MQLGDGSSRRTHAVTARSEARPPSSAVALTVHRTADAFRTTPLKVSAGRVHPPAAVARVHTARSPAVRFATGVPPACTIVTSVAMRMGTEAGDAVLGGRRIWPAVSLGWPGIGT